MGGRTGPKIILSSRHHTGTDGVSLYVTYRSPRVLFVHYGNLWPALPKVAGEAVLRVEVSCVRGVRILQGLRQAAFRPWNGDKVNVIGHQCITPNAHVSAGARLLEYAHVNQEIGVVMKHGILTHTPLSDVMSIVWNNASQL